MMPPRRPPSLLLAPSSASTYSWAFSSPRSSDTPLLELHAFFAEITDRPRVERDRRIGHFLHVQGDRFGFLVNGDELGALVEDRLDHVVRGRLAEFLVRDEDV